MDDMAERGSLVDRAPKVTSRPGAFLSDDIEPIVEGFVKPKPCPTPAESVLNYRVGREVDDSLTSLASVVKLGQMNLANPV